MKRKYETVSRHPGIYRILVVDQSGKATEPLRGVKYAACVEAGDVAGGRRRIKRNFQTFAEAKEFRNSATRVKDFIRDSLRPKSKMKFKDLSDKWCVDVLPHLDRTTQSRYRSYLQHFQSLNEMEVENIDPSAIDRWITFLKRPEYLATLNVTRCGFEHEFTVLRQILRYYASRFNRNYCLPFLADHNKMLKVKEKRSIRKDLTVVEFKKFVEALRESLLGTKHEVVYYIALAQYAIYGRIQDAAALYFEDFDFERNKIYIRRKVQWARVKSEVTRIVDGSKANGGKEIPLSDFAASVFKEWVVRSGIRSGLLFTLDNQIVTYRQIAYRYDEALSKAGLPFTGTHLIRHASLSEHYDTARDILATAKVAGHSDLRATERYAKARDERVAETQRQMDEKLKSILHE